MVEAAPFAARMQKISGSGSFRVRLPEPLLGRGNMPMSVLGPPIPPLPNTPEAISPFGRWQEVYVMADKKEDKKIGIKKMIDEIKADLDSGKVLNMGDLAKKYDRSITEIMDKVNASLDEAYTYGNFEAVTLSKVVPDEEVANPEK